MESNLQDQLLEKILAADRALANSLIDDWAKAHSYELAATKILDPVLIHIGEMWENEEISLAQGYMAGKIAEDIMEKVTLQIKTQNASELKGTVVIGNIEDDFHALGRKLVGTFLRASDWKVYDLGNDVPELESRQVGKGILQRYISSLFDLFCSNDTDSCRNFTEFLRLFGRCYYLYV